MNVFYLAFINAASQAETSNDIDHAIIQYRTRCSPTPSIPYNEMVNVIPFSFERRRSSCIIRNAANNLILICKGASEEIISRCVYIRSGVSQINLDSNCRQQLTAHITELERLGYRVLLLASRKLDLPSASTDPIDETHESDMVLEGIIALSQPLKEDASSAIDETQNLGVEVKILTGDSLEHALRTCHDLRLSHGFHDDVETLTGPQLDEITDIKQLDATVQRT
jgi:Mg2+-importing ATPase